ARRDGRQDGVARGAVLQVMAVPLARRKAGTVAGAQDLLTRVVDQDHLSLEDPDELVLALVEVALARPGAGRQPRQVDAELGQPSGDAELPVLARAARFVERGRIFAAAHERRGRDVDLGHRRQIALSNGQFASSRTLVPPTRITTFAPLGFASDYWLLRERKAARGPITWLSGPSSAVTMSTWLKPSLRWTSNPPGT